MAITPMQKIMVVAHQSQVTDLLTAIQDAGLVQILDAQRAMVTKEWPELHVEARKPRELEELVARLEKAIRFLDSNAAKPDGTSLFSPRIEMDDSRYSQIISGSDALRLLEEAEVAEGRLQQLAADRGNIRERLERLHIWRNLDTPVEELGGLKSAVTFVGLIPAQHFSTVSEELAEVGGIIQAVGESETQRACIVVVLEDQAAEVSKLLRNSEFEAVSFENMHGTPAEIISRNRQQLDEAEAEYEKIRRQAVELAENRLDLKVLYDHYFNLLDRRSALSTAPATEHAVFLEGWTQKQNYSKLETLVAKFDSCSVFPMDRGEGEVPPVEIANSPRIGAFETITRLYGMPAYNDVDPTVFLAPFFALFFGICLTDAGYGIIMIAFFWWLLRKIKANKKFVVMMLFCSVTTVVAGALTGGWFGDMIQKFFPQLMPARDALMWFDPLDKPMYFFNISLALGYLQIIFGIAVAFWHKWRQGLIEEALFDHLSWFVWLNSLTLFGLGKAGFLPGWLGTLGGYIAIVPAIAIVLFSEREGGWGARIGMGGYNLFSTVFYIGDVLSYIRLMALGMVTAGFGMAINEIVRTVMGLGVLGWILGALIFIGGHVFNIANSALSAFVHSMRLQFVEFFTKFLVGGGKEFEPLRNEYKYVSLKK